mmetsp:Transcript_49306/g.123594  ORF Transcript_49306/g.123594 Transcript_49306/m.123594 type:complete len:340 (+) Transcript_49306:690-1709(+)
MQGPDYNNGMSVSLRYSLVSGNLLHYNEYWSGYTPYYNVKTYYCSHLLIHASTFENNVAVDESQANGIFFTPALTVTQSLFRNNQAPAFIFYLNGGTTIEASSFINNKPSSLRGSYTGILHAHGPAITISECLFHGNQPGVGELLQSSNTPFEEGTDIIIRRSTFRQNRPQDADDADEASERHVLAFDTYRHAEVVGNCFIENEMTITIHATDRKEDRLPTETVTITGNGFIKRTGGSSDVLYKFENPNEYHEGITVRDNTQRCADVCGNGLVMPGIEECDDVGTPDSLATPENGDGCSASCTIEEGWECNNLETFDDDGERPLLHTSANDPHPQYRHF